MSNKRERCELVLEVKQPRPIWEILFSTHHTDIGLLYLYLSVTALIIGGALAVAIRTELFLPGTGDLIPDSNLFRLLLALVTT